MATITFTGPDLTRPGQQATSVVELSDASMAQAVEALCVTYGYQPTVAQVDQQTGETTQVANPVGPGTFAIQRMLGFVIDTAKAYKAKVDSEAARIAAIADVEAQAEFTITDVPTP